MRTWEMCGRFWKFYRIFCGFGITQLFHYKLAVVMLHINRSGLCSTSQTVAPHRPSRVSAVRAQARLKEVRSFNAHPKAT